MTQRICLTLLLLAPLAALADPMELSIDDQLALDLGRRIMGATAALENPQAPAAMEAILSLGRDSRYHTMMRGWLTQLLVGDLSIAEASGDQVPPKIQERIDFLQRAIRAIDLE